MKVSVVVVTFQSEDTLARCLGSIPGDAEVVVVDNASRDRSAEIAAAAGALLVRNDDNRGYATAANQGERRATGDAILFLNPDAELAPGCVEYLVAALTAQSELVIVGPNAIESSTGAERGLWPYPSARRTWVNQLGLHRLMPRRTPTTGFVVGTCMLVRRAWFQRLDGFDERYWLYGEDADFCRRALALGGRCATVAGAAVNHVGGHSSDQLASSFDHFHRGTELFIRTHSGPFALASHRSAVLFGAVTRAALFAPFNRTRSRWFLRLAGREAGLLIRSPLAVQ